MTDAMPSNAHVAQVVELSVTSDQSFEHAVQLAADTAKNSLGDPQSIWVKEQRANLSGGTISEYQVNVLVTYFPLEGKPKAW